MFNLKSEEILTYLLLIIVGYYIAKMFSRRCNGFSVGGPNCSIYSNNMHACNNTSRCAYHSNSQECVETELLPEVSAIPPPGMNPRPPQRTKRTNDYCMRNMAQGLSNLGDNRTINTTINDYNTYCSNNGCYYSDDHSEHTCRSCDSIDLTNIQDKNVYCQNTSNSNCYYNDNIQKCAFD